MKALTAEWVDKAEGDYQVAQDQWKAPTPVFDAICFHAQQCAEKYLKAWLTEQGTPFPRTHDLESLAKFCLPTFPDLSAILNDLRFLTSFGVEVRYPGTSA